MHIGFNARGNIEIDPHAVRADFQFPVMRGVGRIGLEENFSDIAVPKPIATAGGFSIGENGNDARAGVEFDEQGFGRPEESDFCFTLGVGVLSLPVRVEAQRCDGVPLECRWKTIGIRIVKQADGDGCDGI